MTKNYISSLLLSLSIFLLLLMGVLIYLTYSTNTVFRNDAYIINATGMIRGSIQRLSKFELTGCTQVCDDISDAIDFKINDILKINYVDEHAHEATQFSKQLKALAESWQQLKILHGEYRSNPDEKTKNEIIAMSEYCWSLADTLVMNAQITTEGKLERVKMFYPVSVLIVLGNILSIFIIFTTVRKKLEHHAAIDALTGIYNRYTFEQVLENEIYRSLRFDRSFTILYFDIDKFKNINDSFGHHIGDTVLIEITKLVRKSIRKIDTLSRIGGEEFSIIVPEISKSDAYKMADKIRSAVENHHFTLGEKVTISIGVAEYSKNMHKEELISQADKAMYKAKQNGRNRVELYD
ncbi:MAG: GGDEF domain-containing protein [Proteobacteria bacterium]|nr:GGDEF domain-containing protein [Pseudomonadota bacterium]NOG59450.1 GGDEF domain-containing protein [Pseudomonadota bacterium]